MGVGFAPKRLFADSQQQYSKQMVHATQFDIHLQYTCIITVVYSHGSTLLCVYQFLLIASDHQQRLEKEGPFATAAAVRALLVVKLK